MTEEEEDKDKEAAESFEYLYPLIPSQVSMFDVAALYDQLKGLFNEA